MCKFFVILTAFLMSATASWAAPEISLTAGGEEEMTHVSTRPLKLLITVSDRSAANLTMESAQNKRLLESFKATPEYAALSKETKKKFENEYSSTKVSSTKFGSGKSLASEFSFVVTTAKGEPVKTQIRSLKTSNQAKGPFEIGQNGTLILHFGLDAASLAALGEGDFLIVGKGGKDTQSNPLLIHLKKSAKLKPEQTLEALIREGNFYRLDENWTELDRIAQELMAQFPKKADGWIFKGDVLLAQSKPTEALAAYHEALIRAQENLPKDDKKGPSEAPRYILRKIAELEGKA